MPISKANMVTSETAAKAFSFCESIVKGSKNIVIASLLQNNESIGWFVRPGTPIPDEDATSVKITQTTVVTSIIRQNESYLGKVRFILVQQEMADVILFPCESNMVLCTVVIRPYDLQQLVAKISDSLDLLYHQLIK